MRKRYSEEQKYEILKDLQASGLSRAAYCRREGLSYQNVSKWASGNGVGSTKLTLLEVSNDGIETGWGITVRVGESIELNFPATMSMEQLALFCREVERC